MRLFAGKPVFQSTWILDGACACISVLIFTAGWLMAMGLQHQARRIGQRHDQGVALYRQTETLRTKHDELKATLAMTRQQVQILQARLPDAPGETTFMQQLSGLAAESGIEISDFRPGSVADRVTCKEMELRFRASGKYAGICRLLAGLRDMPRAVRVSQLTVAAPMERGGDCTIDCQVGLPFGRNEPTPIRTAVNP